MKIDYTALANAVQQGETMEEAFTRLSAATVTEDKAVAKYSELSLMSELGVTLADTILTKIEAQVSARVVRMIQSVEGVNLADPETKGLLAGLLAGGALTQAEHDALIDLTKETKPVWPNLKLGHVQNAMEWRAEGYI